MLAPSQRDNHGPWRPIGQVYVACDVRGFPCIGTFYMCCPSYRGQQSYGPARLARDLRSDAQNIHA